MTTHYSELDLRKLKGQALKDVWHAMIGKGPGIKNTTGLKNSEEILEAILKGQDDPAFLERFGKREYKQEVEVKPVEPMPPKEKKKPGPKPAAPVPVPVPVHVPVQIHAVEGPDAPKTRVHVEKIRLHKLQVGSTLYFLDKESNNVYSVENNRPGSVIGTWDPTQRTLLTRS
jgi:hypothetical protein